MLLKRWRDVRMEIKIFVGLFLLSIFSLLLFGLLTGAFNHPREVWMALLITVVLMGLSVAPIERLMARYVELEEEVDELTASLIAAEQLKKDFVSIASHQLRTPLTVIRLYSEMLTKEAAKFSPKHRKYLSTVSFSTEKMARLINELLNLSRIESGRIRVDPVLTDVAMFVKTILLDLRSLAVMRLCTLEFSKSSTKMPKIPLDQDLLRHVVTNIVENAIKYAGQRKNSVKVCVSPIMKSKKPFARISVRDEGIGIPRKEQARLYEKFFRGTNARTVMTEGTGLGLYLCKVILDLTGGALSFTSIEGKGSTFHIDIPFSGMRYSDIGDRMLHTEKQHHSDRIM